MSQHSWPQALLFDVDGVLIDSLDVKGEAFADVFSDVPDSRDTVVAFHRTHGGVTRSIKIGLLYERLMGEAPAEVELETRVRSFGEAVRQRVIDAPEIEGAHAALERWSQRCPLHAVSATPSEELTVILKARGLAAFFTGIHGWPPAKADAVRALLSQYGYEPEWTVLVGDSHEDFAAAQKSGVRFVHLVAPGASAFEGPHPTIAQHIELDCAIAQTFGAAPD